jgi:UDP-N-acetylmuramoylalanine--D-glutamate ligase
MQIPEIQGKKITVLGAARSGVAAAKLLAGKGAHLLVSEQAAYEKKEEEGHNLKALGIETEFGGHTSQIYDSDFWVVSPGISLSSPVIQNAKKQNIPIYGELEVASWYCQSPIVAVTGSNGKSTVTAILGEIFKNAAIPCVVAGNIGSPFSGSVERTVPEGVAVLEVSSFQLETIHKFHPKISILLNLTPDHLDRHGSMSIYGAIKSRIFENQSFEDWFIYNGCDDQVKALARKAKCKKAVFGLQDSTMPSGFIHDGQLTYTMDTAREMVMSIQDMRIRGEHNALNALAVLLAARLMDVPVNNIRNTLQSFPGLPHRLEFVREVDGIRWINDSKGTNVDSVWYALGSFLEPVILIAGGRDKDSDFSRLKKKIQERVRGIVLLGEAAEKMKEVFFGLCPIQTASSLQNAVEIASQIARNGDVVLLSPACASFDMFRNFEDRGDHFKELVRNL